MTYKLHSLFFFFQAEDGIRDLVRSRGLGDVYKRQAFGLDAVPQRVALAQTHGPALLADGLRLPFAADSLSLIHI